MSDFWRNLEEIFDEICVLDDERRRAVMERKCAGDQRLSAADRQHNGPGGQCGREGHRGAHGDRDGVRAI